ncbi:Hpt domain-containing protein [Desulfatitalea alkaliphila]|uniref:Hpt domain-containing protein n=1 Tax=Desulfatitalea alkaliphila TaxID=2929485 RepID=A0AA41R0B5_9BACT|nr:Hpt domain-containing protein [Desulfatitalea alkaliphila]MCJ8500477.1 Hpt domain-containing protein [Desulfatitalea alkaliphila]
MPDQNEPLDLKGALKRAMGDTAFLQMMYDEFQQMLPDNIARMAQACDAREMGLLARQAHQLKGSAANLGANEIAAAALQLEQSANAGAVDQAAATLAALKCAAGTLHTRLCGVDWGALAAADEENTK